MVLAAIRRTMLRLGDVLDGRYRIDAVIGHGGMSVVYRATHVHLGQPVALKVLFSNDEGKRLEREARAAACIRGEHVVRVFDVGRLASGAPYLVMEFVDGEDLAALLARRRTLPVAQALDFVLQACEAVAQAHALGIVHRDLKPANLLVTERPDGSPLVKVLDFGISRGKAGPSSVHLTDPGIVLGTPMYMAPEQMEGKESADQRVDIWALGAILYEMLVGRPPFEGDALPLVFMEIMTRKVERPSAARHDVPRQLDAIVARCLAVDPRARFTSIVELAWALAEVGPARTREIAVCVARTWDRGRALAGMSTSPSHALPKAGGVVGDMVRRLKAPLRIALAGTALVALPLMSVVARSSGVPEPPDGVASSPVHPLPPPAEPEEAMETEAVSAQAREHPPLASDRADAMAARRTAGVPLPAATATATVRREATHAARAPIP